MRKIWTCWLLLTALVGPRGAAGQDHRPWQGRGVAPRGPAAVSDDAGSLARAQAVAMVGMTVSDMDRAVDFYTHVLEFQKVSDDELAGSAYEMLSGVFGARVRVVRVRLGQEYLQLTQFLASPGRVGPPDARSNDRWFQHVAIVVRDMTSAYARLRRFKVQYASTGPQLLPPTIPAAAGIRAFYFRDPDGHTLEILQFPPDKGDPRWRSPGSELFLGIDHSAIVVSDTRASLAFYRDVLGFRVMGESTNFGTEQEHLNNVQGARLHVTSLRAPAGPGLEFLEYLAPRDGRPYPPDERSNDLVHWQTTVSVGSVAAAATAVRRGNFRLSTGSPVDLPDTSLGFRRALLVRDPDGHVVQLAEH